MKTELIDKPFEKDEIFDRKGRGNKTYTYATFPAYVRRMNEVFDYMWSMDVVSVDILEDSEVVAVVSIKANEFTKVQAGGSKITRDKDGNAISLGDDYKAAITVAFKKACQMFGIGLHLSDDPDRDNKPPVTPKNSVGPTAAQLALIKKMREERNLEAEAVNAISRAEFDGKEVMQLTAKQASELIGKIKEHGTK